jgi:hypothetical protein
MQTKQDEVRELVREIIREGLVGNEINRAIKRGGEQIRITRDGDGVTLGWY